jgi:hypothetical protein
MEFPLSAVSRIIEQAAFDRRTRRNPSRGYADPDGNASARPQDHVTRAFSVLHANALIPDSARPIQSVAVKIWPRKHKESVVNLEFERAKAITDQRIAAMMACDSDTFLDLWADDCIVEGPDHYLESKEQLRTAMEVD